MIQHIERAGITSIGVYSYTLPDGTKRRDLRKPEEVFSYDSLQSLRGVPVTLDHPTAEQIEARSYDIYGAVITASQGWELNEITNVVGDISMFKEVKDLKDYSLSAGYKCEVELTPGVWCGIEYDAVQTKIEYNHVALVPVSRAGETTSLKEAHMDSANGQIATKVEPGSPAPAAEAQKPSVETKADAAETKVTPAVAPEVKTEETKTTVEQKADAATAPTTEAPKAPETPKVETKTDSSDFVTKGEFGALLEAVKGLGETIAKLVPAPMAPTVEVKADSADPKQEPKKPVVEMKTDAADKKPDDLGRSDFISNFFNQTGGK
jgi:hypothetical protein